MDQRCVAVGEGLEPPERRVTIAAMYLHISPTKFHDHERVSLEGIEPSPHGVRIRHAANKHLKLEQVVAAGFEPAPHRLKAGPLPIEIRHRTVGP